LADDRNEKRVDSGRTATEQSDHRNRTLLRTSSQRPRRNRASNHFDEVAPSHAAPSGAHDQANHIQNAAVAPSRTGGLARYNGMRPFLRPVKSARLCVAALEAGLAEILAWERAASVPSAGIALQ